MWSWGWGLCPPPPRAVLTGGGGFVTPTTKRTYTGTPSASWSGQDTRPQKQDLNSPTPPNVWWVKAKPVGRRHCANASAPRSSKPLPHLSPGAEHPVVMTPTGLRPLCPRGDTCQSATAPPPSFGTPPAASTLGPRHGTAPPLLSCCPPSSGRRVWDNARSPIQCPAALHFCCPCHATSGQRSEDLQKVVHRQLPLGLCTSAASDMRHNICPKKDMDIKPHDKNATKSVRPLGPGGGGRGSVHNTCAMPFKIWREFWGPAQKCVHPSTIACAIPCVARWRGYHGLFEHLQRPKGHSFSHRMEWHLPKGLRTRRSAMSTVNYTTNNCAIAQSLQEWGMGVAG